MRDSYVRRVTDVEVIDADTFRCSVDLGFYVRVRMSCRLAGLNAPELGEPGGVEARDALAEMLGRGPVTVESVRADKFAGRFDAVVMVETLNVNDELVARGYAVPWNGRGARPIVPWPPKAAA